MAIVVVVSVVVAEQQMNPQIGAGNRQQRRDYQHDFGRGARHCVTLPKKG